MPPTWLPHPTQDGSFTFFSAEFGETFHSEVGAKSEALLKFTQATDLPQKAARHQLRLLDICYGLGYNSAAALETIWTINPNCQVELYALEQDPTVPLAAIAPPLVDIWSAPLQDILKAIAHHHHCTTPGLQATLLLGDARQTIQALAQQGWQADAIFFDPFSPRRCPQLWTVEFFAQIAHCLAPDGKLATYSRSAAVRSALLAAGFAIGTLPVVEKKSAHDWSEGTVAAFNPTSLFPLASLEQEHLQTRAAVPYRDPTLSDSAEQIMERHRQEQGRSTYESTSSWRRRWGIR